MLLHSLSGALRRGEAVALVDCGAALDIGAAGRAGVPLAQLLWIRCEARQALPAADIVLGAGGFGLLAIDLGEHPPSIPTAAWLRFKRAAEQQGTAVLIVSPRRTAGAWGACALTLQGAQPRFQGRGVLVAIENRVTLSRGESTSVGHPDFVVTRTRR